MLSQDSTLSTQKKEVVIDHDGKDYRRRFLIQISSSVLNGENGDIKHKCGTQRKMSISKNKFPQDEKHPELKYVCKSAVIGLLSGQATTGRSEEPGKCSSETQWKQEGSSH